MRFALDSTPRKNRSEESRKARKLAQPVCLAARQVVEQLESRQLLASVAGGQIGVFQGADGNPVRINITGGGSMDFIGATRDEFGGARLNDIPMTIFDAQTGQVIRENLGGYAGRKGIQLADVVFNNGDNDSKFDGATDPYNDLANGGTSGRVSLDGLASTFEGKTFGVNRYLNGPNNPLVDILRVDSKAGNTAVDSEVSDEMLAELQAVSPLFRKQDILSIIGADFPQDNAGLLYFAANVNFPTSSGGATPTITRESVPAMFIYNTVTKDVTLDVNFFGFSDPTNDAIRIDDFAFTSDGQIAMFGSVQINGDTAPQVGLFFSDPDAIVPDQFREVRIGEQGPGQPLPPATTELAAVEIISGEDFMIAVTDNDPAGGGDSASLVRIDLATGRGRVIGTVVNPDEPTTVTSRLGENIRDLAWNSRITDNFFQIGKRGGMLGSEGTQDVLVALDVRERFPNTDLYAIYGTHVQSDTSLSIANFALDDDTDLPFNTRLFRGIMNPYDGSAGVVRTNMTNGIPVNVALPNGGLYVGIRTRDITNAISVPVLSLQSDDFAGSGAGISLPDNVRPGVYINGTMNDLFIGGTVTGSINIDGSIDTLYAGNIITGDPLNGDENGSDNFFVKGDIRDLVVRGGLGTLAGAPTPFAPQTDLLVGGRIQQIRTGSAYRGALDVAGRTSELTLGNGLMELESTPDQRIDDREALAFEGRLGSLLGENQFEIVDDVTRNDDFDTAQIVGSYYSKRRKTNGQWTLAGVLNNGPNFDDSDDYYGVPMLAGQSMEVTLDGQAITNVAIFDPNGNLYSQDRSNLNADKFINQKIRVTADKPGVWRIRVNADDPGRLVDLDRPYSLTVDKIGEMAVGGIMSLGNAFFDRQDMGVRVRSGDLGAINTLGLIEAAGQTIAGGRNQTFANSFFAQQGNIRSIDAASSIGRLQGGSYVNLPNVRVPQGSVGLIRAGDFAYVNAFGISPNTAEPIPESIIGGDYQVIEAANDVSGTFAANGSIGVIRAGSFASTVTNLPGYIQINADDSGTAEIGLIEVGNDFGSFQYGGPTINVGDGGNARYLDVGGEVFRPLLRGSGSLAFQTAEDEPLEILDDSGALVTLTPYDGIVNTNTGVIGGTTGGIPDPFGGANSPTGSSGIPDPFGGGVTDDPFGGAGGGVIVTPTPPEDDIVGTLTAAGYPVTNGGQIIYAVTSTTGIAISTDAAAGGIADITRLDKVPDTSVNAISSPAIINSATAFDVDRTAPSRLTPLTLGTGTTLDVIMTGSTINVYNIGGNTTGLTNFGRIINDTDGEIANITAGDVGYISGQYVGVARAVNGVKVEGLNSVTDGRFTATTAPLSQLGTAIFIDNAIDIRSRGPIGNIVAQGVVQNLAANSDGVNIKGLMEGVVGPLVAGGAINSDTGFRRIDVGEGLATSGSGDFAQSGIFSNGSIGLITNDNGGGDIRGDIIADQYIEGIRLSSGGSIVDADIMQATNLSSASGAAGADLFNIGTEEVAVRYQLVAGGQNRTVLNGIGDIRTSGYGGIINTRVVGYNMGRIIVSDDGFGLLNSEINSNAGANMAGASIGGLGMRNTTFTGGSTIGDITATGSGNVLDIRNFTRSVRGSESNSTDVQTGLSPNAATDVNLFLGTTKKLTKIDGVTNSGVLQNDLITAARSVNSISAFEIRGVSDIGARPRDESFPMQINFANSIGSITTKRNMNGVRISGGTIGTIAAGRDMVQFQLNSNASVKTISAGRNILGTTNFNLQGNGTLDQLQVAGNMNGTMFAAKGIRSIVVGGNVQSAAGQGGIRSGRDINLLDVGGSVIGTAYIRAGKLFKSIRIRGDLTEDATLRASSFGTVVIDGRVDGHIIRG